MIKEILLLLCFLSCVFTFNVEMPSFGKSTHCEKCTIQVENAIRCINDIIKNTEPFVSTECKPCSRCEMRGLSPFSITKGTQVCTEAVPNGKEHTFHVTFEKMILDCTCTLDCDPSQIPNKVLNSLSSNKMMKCDDANQQKALLGLQDSLTKRVSSISNAQNIAKSCKSTQSGSAPTNGQVGISIGGDGANVNTGGTGTGGKPCPKGTTSGHVHAEWVALKIKFTTVTDSTSQKVRIGSVEFENNDEKNLTYECRSDDDPNFVGACKCLLATNFHADLITKTSQMVLPCYVDSQADNYENIFQYLKCDESDY